jgi:transcriptional regulator GlxA family with amidase domain
MATAKKKSERNTSSQRIGEATDIFLLVFPKFLLLDATGPIQVFSSANDEAIDAGLPPPYRIHLISKDGGAVASSAGVSVITQTLPRSRLTGATLLVAGGRVNCLPEDAATLRWISRASEAVARCCAVCTGAFVLARAGLLDGRRAVTHWQEVLQLQEEHPNVQVHDDAIFVHDGKFYTSAGISAGMDLALSLVEEDLGRAAALGVAKRMVLYLKRSGGQRQFSSELLAQTQEEGVSAELTTWLRPRLAQAIDVEQMAAACAISVRSLHRKLQEESNITPAQLLAGLRLELACSLLEQGGISVKETARRCGYGTEYNLRRAFSLQLGVLPSEYQMRFA